jgi:DNA-binding transcriptional ArsR family regulator
MTDLPGASQTPDPAEPPLDTPRTVKRVTDPRALRALAHPTRLALVGLLRLEGPLTATQAGAMLGESSGSTSFHLRQLARYGMVEEAGGGQGREKPWRATANFTQWSDDSEEPGAAEAAGLFSSFVAERYFEDLRHWLQAEPGEPQEWRDAAQFGDTVLYLTAEELADLKRQTQAMTDRFLDRHGHPERRPPGARPVTYLHLAFPLQRIMGHPLPPANPAAPTGPASPPPAPTGPRSPAGPGSEQ